MALARWLEQFDVQDSAMTRMFNRLVCIDGTQKSKTTNAFDILGQEKARRPLATPPHWDSCCVSEILAEETQTDLMGRSAASPEFEPHRRLHERY